MAEPQRRVFLDLPYVVPFLTGVGHVAAYRPQWGVQYVIWFQRISRGDSVPRFGDLQGTKERVLWQLLLYDKVLMPLTTLRLWTLADGLRRPLSPDFEKLVTLDFVETVEEPPPDLVPPEARVSSDLVRGLRPIIVADLARDGVEIAPLESEIAEGMIGCDEYENLKKEESRLYETFMPKLSQKVVLQPTESWDEIKSRIQKESSGPISVDAVSSAQLEDRVHQLVRDAFASRFGRDRIKDMSKDTILALYGSIRNIEDSSDRLRRIFFAAAEKDADLKLDVTPSPDVTRIVSSRVQGEGVQQVINVFLDAAQFPRIETVEDVVRHRGERYIDDMRRAIFAWAAAIGAGALKDEAHLRREIQSRINEAGRRIRRWRTCRVSLGAVDWTAKGVAVVAAASSLAADAALWGTVSFAAALGGRFSKWMEGRKVQHNRWLLHGRET